MGALALAFFAAGCSSATEHYEVLSFNQDYSVSDVSALALAAVAQHSRTTMWLGEDAHGTLLSVVSQTIDRTSGATLTMTTWHAGDSEMTILRLDRCLAQSYAIPTETTRDQVIGDSVGPLGDPTAAGYQASGPGVYERIEGPSRLVLRPSASLATRTLTMVDTSTGTTQTVIDHITLAPGAAPASDLAGSACPSGGSTPERSSDAVQLMR